MTDKTTGHKLSTGVSSYIMGVSLDERRCGHTIGSPDIVAADESYVVCVLKNNTYVRCSTPMASLEETMKKKEGMIQLGYSFDLVVCTVTDYMNHCQENIAIVKKL